MCEVRSIPCRSVKAEDDGNGDALASGNGNSASRNGRFSELISSVVDLGCNAGRGRRGRRRDSRSSRTTNVLIGLDLIDYRGRIHIGIASQRERCPACSDGLRECRIASRLRRGCSQHGGTRVAGYYGGRRWRNNHAAICGVGGAGTTRIQSSDGDCPRTNDLVAREHAGKKDVAAARYASDQRVLEFSMRDELSVRLLDFDGPVAVDFYPFVSALGVRFFGSGRRLLAAGGRPMRCSCSGA